MQNKLKISITLHEKFNVDCYTILQTLLHLRTTLSVYQTRAINVTILIMPSQKLAL